MGFRKTKFTKRDSDGRIKSMWTPALKEKARRLYCDEKKSLSQVAVVIGCSPATVQALMNANGWMRKKPPSGTAAEQERKKKRAISLYTKKQSSIPRIARELELSVGKVTAWLKLAGVFDAKVSMRNSYWSNPSRPQYVQAQDTWNRSQSIPESYEEYAKLVRDLSSIVWRYFKATIPNHHLVKKNEYAADHAVSIRDGWWKWNQAKYCYVKRQKIVPPWVLAHPANLQVINWSDNIRKGGTSYTTFDQLKTMIGKWESKHGKITEISYQNLGSL